MITIGNKQFDSILNYKNELIRLNNLYRIGLPEISDKEFDELYQKYVMLSGETIQDIDGVVNFIKLTGEKDNLQIEEFTGLNKLTTIDDFIKWIVKYNLIGEKLIITPKYDGVSTFVNYDLQNSINKNHLDVYIKSKDNGASPIWNHFIHTQNKTAIQIPNKEQHIGEIMCSNNVFEQKYSQEYKNVRNFVAGKLNPSSESSQCLNDFVFLRYTLVNSDLSKSEMIDYLNQYNVCKVPYIEFAVSDTNKQIIEEKFYEFYKNWSKDFVIDGLVIDVDNIEIRKSLGFDTKGNPKYSVAYKNEDTFGDRANVKVRSIQFPIDKDGQFNPCITTDLVMLDGAECGKNIFVDTIDFIRKNNISVGADIIIKRGGQIIPRVYKVLNNFEHSPAAFESYESMVTVGILPKTCPYCGAEISYDENEVTMKCSNKNCVEVFFRCVEFFFTQINAKGIGEKLIRQFIDEIYREDNDYLDFILSILRTSESEFRKFENFGERKAEIVYSSIHDALNNASLALLMSATNLFPNLAETKISWVLEKYDITFDNVEKLKDLTFDDIKSVIGYAEKSASVFFKGTITFIFWYENIKEIFELKENTSSVAEDISNELVDQKFCFTGFRSADAEKLIIKKGGKIKNSFSLDITILVVKDKSISTTKVEKAEKAGIKIIDENELNELLGISLNMQNNKDLEIQNQQTSIF